MSALTAVLNYRGDAREAYFRRQGVRGARVRHAKKVEAQTERLFSEVDRCEGSGVRSQPASPDPLSTRPRQKYPTICTAAINYVLANFSICSPDVFNMFSKSTTCLFSWLRDNLLLERGNAAPKAVWQVENKLNRSCFLWWDNLCFAPHRPLLIHRDRAAPSPFPYMHKTHCLLTLQNNW